MGGILLIFFIFALFTGVIFYLGHRGANRQGRRQHEGVTELSIDGEAKEFMSLKAFIESPKNPHSNHANGYYADFSSLMNIRSRQRRG